MGRRKHPRALTCFLKHIILASPNHLPTPPPTSWPSIAHINIYWLKAKSRHYDVWFNNKLAKSKLISFICCIKFFSCTVLHMKIGKNVHGYQAKKQKTRRLGTEPRPSIVLVPESRKKALSCGQTSRKMENTTNFYSPKPSSLWRQEMRKKDSG